MTIVIAALMRVELDILNAHLAVSCAFCLIKPRQGCRLKPSLSGNYASCVVTVLYCYVFM